MIKLNLIKSNEPAQPVNRWNTMKVTSSMEPQMTMQSNLLKAELKYVARPRAYILTPGDWYLNICRYRNIHKSMYKCTFDKIVAFLINYDFYILKNDTRYLLSNVKGRFKGTFQFVCPTFFNQGLPNLLQGILLSIVYMYIPDLIQARRALGSSDQRPQRP